MADDACLQPTHDRHPLVQGAVEQEKAELVPAGKTVTLTPAERRLNENKVSREAYNPFTNGQLRPMFLLEDDPDYERLMGNPNVLTDQEIKKIFRLGGERFYDRIEQIDHPTVLEKLRELAEDPRTKATVHQMQMITSRIAAVGVTTIEEGTQFGATENQEERPSTGRPVTPS